MDDAFVRRAHRRRWAPSTFSLSKEGPTLKPSSTSRTNLRAFAPSVAGRMMLYHGLAKLRGEGAKQTAEMF